MKDEITFNVYGVRGSQPLSQKDYLDYGGNTSSYTIRTPNNTVIFLDAGTGLVFAQEQLDTPANDVWVFLSHTHIDHTLGLGMSRLPWLQSHPKYKNTRVNLVGPKGFKTGLKKLYDGKKLWPVFFSNSKKQAFQPNMPSLDISNANELSSSQTEFSMDSGISVRWMYGNHSIKDGVVIYRFGFTQREPQKSLVYATDIEFDYLKLGVKNPSSEQLKADFIAFIDGADILVADAQYTREEYQNTKGYGHSFHQQMIDLSEAGNIKRLIITHHNKHGDRILAELEQNAKNYAKRKNVSFEVIFAKEGSIFAL